MQCIDKCSRKCALIFHYSNDDAAHISLSQTVVKRKDVDGDIIFFIHPPRIGFYKLLLYGIPRPSEKGKWRLPLIASFLIESKLSRSDGEPPKEPETDAKKKIRLKPRAR